VWTGSSAQICVGTEFGRTQKSVCKGGSSVELRSESVLNNQSAISLYFITSGVNCVLILGVNKPVVLNTVSQSAQVLLFQWQLITGNQLHPRSTCYLPVISLLASESIFRIMTSYLSSGQHVQPWDTITYISLNRGALVCSHVRPQAGILWHDYTARKGKAAGRRHQKDLRGCNNLYLTYMKQN
jgi:hypothetical protein